MTRHRGFFPVQGALIFFTALFLLAGCALPRVIVLHDPLSAVEHDRLGRIYESQADFGQAREQYRMALEQDRKHLPSLLLLGDLSFKLKDYREAESAYRKALELDPENGDACNNLAWVYIQTGRNFGEAKTLVDRALKANPAHRSYYLDTLGVLLLKTGDAPGAIKALSESLETLPQDRPELLAEAKEHLAEASRAAVQETR